MKKYQCPKAHFDINDPTMPAAYSIMGKDPLPVDEEGQIFWHIHNFSNDIEKFHQIGAFANAFSYWERWLYPWTFVATADPNKAVWHIRTAQDNKIPYEGAIIPSPWDFDKHKDTIAVQWAYLPGFKWSLTMIMNDNFMFSLLHGDNHNQVMIETVIRHEIGHGLNLGHTPIKGAIMGDTYQKESSITIDEVNGLWYFHGDRLRADSKRLLMPLRYIKEVTQPGAIQQEQKLDSDENKNAIGIGVVLFFGIVLYLIYLLMIKP